MIFILASFFLSILRKYMGMEYHAKVSKNHITKKKNVPF